MFRARRAAGEEQVSRSIWRWRSPAEKEDIRQHAVRSTEHTGNNNNPHYCREGLPKEAIGELDSRTCFVPAAAPPAAALAASTALVEGTTVSGGWLAKGRPFRRAPVTSRSRRRWPPSHCRLDPGSEPRRPAEAETEREGRAGVHARPPFWPPSHGSHLSHGQ